MFRFSKQQFFDVGFGVVICVAMAVILTGCTGFGNSATPSSKWYLHWTCGNQSQCASDMGSYYGVWNSYSTQALCASQQNTWAATDIMQPYLPSVGVGSWCDENSSPASVPSASAKHAKRPISAWEQGK
jgi:hypothetical protein